jgi:diguanylate cyclase (GGDEF)-like protein
MKKEQVLSIVLESDTVPTLSTVASKLIQITAEEGTSIREIADLISKDISISTKVLRIVNSALYNFPQKIGTVHQACMILGSNAIRNLVLSISFLKLKASESEDSFDYGKFWEKSLAAGVSAKLIMKNVADSKAEEVFIAGLLQNVGELMLSRSFPQKYEHVLHEHNSNFVPIEELERKHIGADHIYIGTEMARHWGFPEELCNSIKFHHNLKGTEELNEGDQLSINVVYLSGLLSLIFYSNNPQRAIDIFRKEAQKILGLHDAIIDTILDMVNTEVEQAATFFGIKLEFTKSITEILQEANQELSQMNLSYEQMNRELLSAKEQLQKLTEELQEKNKFLENLANFDGLTQVYNHRYFQLFLEKEINRAKRSGLNLSLILMDIDFFKKFNDTYGHQVGDFILKEFCKATKTLVRQYDLVARYGGEEFVIVLPDTSNPDAKHVAEKIRKFVDTYRFRYEDKVYHVSISLGVSTYSPTQKGYSKNELIELADKALYVAKKNGRNRVVVHSPK